MPHADPDYSLSLERRREGRISLASHTEIASNQLLRSKDGQTVIAAIVSDIRKSVVTRIHNFMDRKVRAEGVHLNLADEQRDFLAAEAKRFSVLAAGYSQGFDLDSVGPKREWHESELGAVDSMTLAAYPVPQLLRHPSGGVGQHAEKHQHESGNDNGSDPGVDGTGDHEAPRAATRAWSKEMLGGSWGSSANIPMNDTTNKVSSVGRSSALTMRVTHTWRTEIPQRSFPSMEQWRPVMGRDCRWHRDACG